MRKVVCISGVPGTGKTSLMRKFMEGYEWVRMSPAKLVETHYCKELDLHIVGKYEDGEVFAGSDRLSMAAAPEVLKWIETVDSNILFEGDRLTGQKIFTGLMQLDETSVSFIILKVEDSILKQRYKDRGSNQPEIFLQGRATKIANIESNFDFMDLITTFPNENLDERDIILGHIKEIFVV